MSTTFVSSAVGMAAGLVQVGVVTELGLDASVMEEKEKKYINNCYQVYEKEDI